MKAFFQARHPAAEVSYRSMSFGGGQTKPQVVDDDVNVHNTSEEARASRSHRWAARRPNRTTLRNGFGEDVETCGRDARAPPAAANTAPQRASIFTKEPADVLDQATSEIAMGTKLGIGAPRKLAGEGFKRPWPPLIKMDESTRKKIDALFDKR